MTNLYALTYISDATRNLSPLEIDGILTDAQQFNASCEVTGVLFHGAGKFFQLLEGPTDSVLSVFERLKLAKAHQNVSVQYKSIVAERNFASWHMGFIEAPGSEIQELAQASWIDSFPVTRTALKQSQGLGLVLFYWNKWLAEATGPAP